jgi:hypothetical protein
VGPTGRMQHARTLALFLVVTGTAAASGCGLNQEGVSPPANTFFYPASAITDTTGRWLFVTNSNADLRYNDGTVVTVDLAAAGSDWTQRGGTVGNDFVTWGSCPEADYVNTSRPISAAPHFCCWDQLDPNILNCDERGYIDPNASVRIGSFAAGMVLQDAKVANDSAGAICTGGDNSGRRLFVAVRGDTSITWMDVDQSVTPPALHCVGDASTPQEPFAACDGGHRLTQAPVALASASLDPSSPSVPLPNEPYALAIDDYYGLLYVGHLTGDTGHAFTGGFSLFDVAPDGSGILPPPEFIAPFPIPFPPNTNGLFGITAFSVARQASGPSQIYASSRYVPMVDQLGATTTCSDLEANGQRFRDIAAFPSGDSYNTGLSGAETRGIEFVADPEDPNAPGRPFVLQRVPPALVTFTRTFDPRGSLAPATMIETCSSPTYLYQYPPPGQPLAPGQSRRLLVNCYDVGEIDVFDTVAPHLTRAFSVGRGPAGLVFPPDPTVAFGRPVAYVVGFGDNNISVIDLAPGSPTELHVIQRIGFPSTVPR